MAEDYALLLCLVQPFHNYVVYFCFQEVVGKSVLMWMVTDLEATISTNIS